METNNYIKTAVGALVVILVAVAVILPIFSAAEQTTKTFDNSEFGIYHMKELEIGDTWTRNNSIWSYEGDPVTTADTPNVSVIITDNAVVRLNGQMRGTLFNVTNVTAADTVSVGSSGALLFNNGDTPAPYTSGYGAANDGEYVLKSYTDSAYVKGDTPIWASGVTGFSDISNGNFIVHLEGTIDDGFTITAVKVYGGSTDNYVIGEATINAVAVDGYEDLYLIESIVFDVSADYTSGDETTTVTTTATYSTFVLPETITAEISNHPTGAALTIIQTLPVIVLVGVLLMIVGAFINNRRA